jgi:hypothetical protein
MFAIEQETKSISVTRGDVACFFVTAKDENGDPYTFQPGDVVRINIHGAKNCGDVAILKDFKVGAATDKVEIFLSGTETKIGDVISKPKVYWYDVCLNPDTVPQTLIGYDTDGAKTFTLYPEGQEQGGAI